MTTIKISKQSIKLFAGDAVIIEGTEYGTIIYNTSHTKCLFCKDSVPLSKPIIINVKELLNTSKFKFSNDEIIECEINADCTQLKTKHNKLIDQINCQIVSSINEKFKTKLFNFKNNNFRKEKNHIRIKNLTMSAKSKLLIFRDKYKIVNFQPYHFTMETGSTDNVISYHNASAINDDKLVEIPTNLENSEVVVCYDKNSIDVMLFIDNCYLILVSNNLEPVLQVCNFVTKKIDSLNESKDLTPLLKLFVNLDTEVSTQIKTYIKESTNINSLMFKLESKTLALYDMIRKVNVLEINIDIDVNSIFNDLQITKETLMFPSKTYYLITEQGINSLQSYKNNNISMYIGETDKFKIYSGI